MIRDICKDETFLAQKAEPATPDDVQVAADLLETLEHHKDGCVGMAANMIGINRRIRQRGHLHGHVQSGDHQTIRTLRRGGGLPLSHRYPPGQALAVHQGSLAE